jgi:hypothetical protein
VIPVASGIYYAGAGVGPAFILLRDPRKIAAKGVILTPALFIDGRKVSEGRVPSVGDIMKLLEGK